nr:glutamic acid-rich protein-like [Ipomoea batatas]
MTKTVDGRFVPYVPYVEESEERFDGNKVPPNLMKKDNKVRRDFQWAKNRAIQEENGRRNKQEEERTKKQEEALEHFRKMKEKMATMEIIKKRDEDHINWA